MKAWILVAFALIGALPAAADSYTYQTISLPGAPVESAASETSRAITQIQAVCMDM